MLNCIGDVHLFRIDFRLAHAMCQEFPRGADEGVPGQIFLVTRLLSDHHYRARVISRVAERFAEDGLRSHLIQLASLAILNRSAQYRKRLGVRNEIGCSLGCRSHVWLYPTDMLFGISDAGHRTRVARRERTTVRPPKRMARTLRLSRAQICQRNILHHARRLPQTAALDLTARKRRVARRFSECP